MRRSGFFVVQGVHEDHDVRIRDQGGFIQSPVELNEGGLQLRHDLAAIRRPIMPGRRGCFAY